MENFELVYDINRSIFIDEQSGYVLSADYIMLEDTDVIINRIKENTGVELDEFFIEALRDTVETCVPTFPFGN